jgi:hypothetical protein
MKSWPVNWVEEGPPVERQTKFLPFWLSFLFCLLFSPAKAIDIRVRLLSTQQLKEVRINSYDGDFYLVALDKDSEVIDTISDMLSGTGRDHRFYLGANKTLSVKRDGSNLGAYTRLGIRFSDSLDIFSLRSAQPERLYRGDIELFVSNDEIIVVNVVNLEEYKLQG